MEEPTIPDVSESYIEAEALELEDYELPTGDFKMTKDGNFYGTFYVLGHVVTKMRPEPFCETDCDEYLYAYFHALSINNKKLEDFLLGYAPDGEGNIQISLGCIDDGLIHFINHSDKYVSKKQILSPELTAAIIGSTAEEPIVLKLEKLPLSGGRGAPVCYSHFATVEYFPSSQ